MAAQKVEPAAGKNITLLIGPEGGFTDDEVSAAVLAGATRISWPETTLRIETAAVVFATMLMSQRKTVD